MASSFLFRILGLPCVVSTLMIYESAWITYPGTRKSSNLLMRLSTLILQDQKRIYLIPNLKAMLVIESFSCTL